MKLLFFWRSRLWVKLTTLFILVGILPILGAGFLTLRSLEKNVQTDVKRRISSLGDISSALIRQYIQKGEEKLSTISQLLAKELQTLRQNSQAPKETLQEELREKVVARLDSLVAPPDIYLEIQFYAAGPKPELVGYAQQKIIPAQNSIDERVQSNTGSLLLNRPLETKETYKAPQIEIDEDFSALPLSTPVISSGTTLGVLVVYLDLEPIRKLLGTVAKGGHHIQVQDGKQQTLLEVGSSLSQEGYISHISSVGYSDWSISIKEEKKRAYASLQEIRQQTVLWIGIALLFATLLAIGITIRILKPIKVLTHTAEQMESGNLSVRAGLKREDEIGRLGAQFDRMAQALERLDTSKSDFVANVSHELRTPLTSIQLSIANLREGVLGPVEAMQEKTLERLQRDVSRLIEMVNALLEMAKLEAGAVSPTRISLSIKPLVNEVIQTVEPLASAKQITLEIFGEGRANADPAMLRRIVLNLLDNAIKFSPKGACVTIAIEEKQFAISDNGPGLSLDEDPFSKFSQGTQRGVKNRGFGLGLAIVKKMVTLHGGEISIQPEKKGTSFLVRL